MSFSVEGKSVIVTGAANGIGRAVARHFVDNGAKVMFADRDEGRLVQELGDVEDGALADYFVGDLREKLTISNLISATVDRFDRIDVLVNAARQVMLSDPLDPSDESIATLMDQNVMAGLRLSKYVAKRMLKQEPLGGSEGVGSIVNLSSVAARRAQPALLGYSMAMAAVDQSTRSLAVAYAAHKIRVNAVAFGSVMSSSLEQALRENEEYRKEIENNTPMERIASPQEVAEAVQYLASDAASFVTGQVLTIDGGRSVLDPVGAPAH
ncbi:MAG: SDR family oxidoreductase [Paracoccaceae bacterium]|jgi:7-alpha-hydroxysteroid dehydrogenase